MKKIKLANFIYFINFIFFIQQIVWLLLNKTDMTKRLKLPGKMTRHANCSQTQEL